MCSRRTTWPVLEGGPPVGCPCHLEDTVGASDTLDTQPAPEAPDPEVLDETPSGLTEARALSAVELVPVTVESSRALRGRHSVERFEEVLV